MSKSIKLIFNYLLAPALFILLSWSLYRQISQQPDLGIRWQQIRSSWENPLLWLVLFLMFVNYGFETRKWQVLLKPLERLPFIKAFRSVFAGCSITMLTPNRVGEFGGRILFVKDENRLRAISLTILGSISQLLVTMIMGIAGLFLLKDVTAEMSDFSWIAGNILLVSSIIFTGILLFVYFKPSWVVYVIERITFLKSFVKYIRILEVFTGKQLLRILFLSFLRYLVFILQYQLILEVMDVQIAFDLCFWMLSVFYLVLAVAPTFGFIELPVRAAASVELLGLFSNNIIGIQAAALAIWIINLVIPAVIGSIQVFGIKILKDK